MLRTIIGFDVDAVGDPIALLSCGHPQHVRHRPPFVSRPWVTSEEGRRGMLGQRLNCVRCERFELPTHFVVVRKMAVDSGLSPQVDAVHRRTERGSWARILVLDGRVRYSAEAPHIDIMLGAGGRAVVVPETCYRVEPLGGARFVIEHLIAPDATG